MISSRTGDARADALVVGLEDLQAVEGVEGLVKRNDGLEAHEERHDSRLGGQYPAVPDEPDRRRCPPTRGPCCSCCCARARRYGELAGLLRIDEARCAGARTARSTRSARTRRRAWTRAAARRSRTACSASRTRRSARATRAFLEGSAGGRAWARVVADELAAGRAATAARDPGARAATTARRRPATAATVATARAASGARPRRERATTSAAPGRPTPPPTRSAPGAPRSSRLGGALLLGGLAIVAIAVVLFFVLRDGGDDAVPRPGREHDGHAAAGEGRGADQPRPARAAARTSRRSASSLVQRAQDQDQIIAAVQGLPKPKSGGYGIWLYSGPGKAQWLGFFASQDNQGRLLARGQLEGADRRLPRGARHPRGEGQPGAAGPDLPARPGADGVDRRAAEPARPLRRARERSSQARPRRVERLVATRRFARRDHEARRSARRPAGAGAASASRAWRSPSAGVEADLGLGAAQQRSNGVPSTSCTQRRTSRRARLEHAEVGAHRAPLVGAQHLGEALAVDALDALRRAATSAAGGAGRRPCARPARAARHRPACGGCAARRRLLGVVGDQRVDVVAREAARAPAGTPAR